MQHFAQIDDGQERFKHWQIKKKLLLLIWNKRKKIIFELGFDWLKNQKTFRIVLWEKEVTESLSLSFITEVTQVLDYVWYLVLIIVRNLNKENFGERPLFTCRVFVELALQQNWNIWKSFHTRFKRYAQVTARNFIIHEREKWKLWKTDRRGNSPETARGRIENWKF